MRAEPLRVLEGGRAPRGWEELWRRDQWRARELPHGDLASANAGRAILHFEGLVQPWLKEAAKRWARARLLAAMAPSTISDNLLHLRAFSRWLAELAPEVGSRARSAAGCSRTTCSRSAPAAWRRAPSGSGSGRCARF